MKRDRAVRMVWALAMAVLAVAAAASTSPRVSAQGSRSAPARAVQASTGSGFTYQGVLADDGTAADGVCDFTFSLWDAEAGGGQLGTTQTVTAAQVTDGRFTVLVNAGNEFEDRDRFGDTAFTGEARWLAIGVRCPTQSGSFTELTPRQALTAAPVAHTLVPGALISGTGAVWDSTGGIGYFPRAGLRVRSDDNAIIVSAPRSGLRVEDSRYGVESVRPTGAGVYVLYSEGDGVEVRSPEDDGIYVQLPGGDGLSVVQPGGDGVKVSSPAGDGVVVNTPAGDGVYVDRPGEAGVYVNRSAGGGVYASSTSSDHFGGEFRNFASSGLGIGLAAAGNAGEAPDIVLGGSSGGGANDNGVIASALSLNTSDLLFQSNHDIYMMLDANADETGAFFVRDDQNSTVWSVDENGNTSASGTKSAVVDAGAYGRVKLYAVESPESWFEDFGSASLVAGEATVAIEPVFAETVNLDAGYHVYLTPLGDCPLYVAEKAADAFTIRAMGGATCEIDVDYRVVAKRAGYEDLRLEVVEASEAERE